MSFEKMKSETLDVVDTLKESARKSLDFLKDEAQKDLKSLLIGVGETVDVVLGSTVVVFGVAFMYVPELFTSIAIGSGVALFANNPTVETAIVGGVFAFIGTGAGLLVKGIQEKDRRVGEGFLELGLATLEEGIFVKTKGQ